MQTTMFDRQAAEGYQQNSSRQRGNGKRFIQNEVKPLPGDIILDLGCGTGELSSYLAELVGHQGKVVGVDPDVHRIKVAQKSYNAVKNLSFVEGSTSNFLDMGSETYDIIFSGTVFHWVENKAEAFENMFSSLNPAGKIAIWPTIACPLPMKEHIAS